MPAELIFLSAITIGELEAGFSLGTRREENKRSLGEFLAEPFVRVVPIDTAVAERYGSLFADLRRAGTPVPTNDIWIAACAIHVTAQLVTFDSDFNRFESLDRSVLKV